MATSYRSQALKLLSAAALGHGMLWLAAITLVALMVICGTVVVLVCLTEKKQRPKVIERLAPTLERLVDAVAFTRRRPRG